MKYVFYAWLLISLCVSCHIKESTAEVRKEKPNIIVIMADDLGFSDLGCYGGEISTPNLDNLAEGGLRFTQFYNTSRCCPSRASLLTGLYPHQAGVGRMTTDQKLPGYRGRLSENAATIAELLDKAGYNTGMTGKWHVSNTNSLENKEQLQWLSHQEDFGDFSDTSSYPTARGFKKYFGNIWGVVDYFDPFSLVNGTEPVKSVPENYYHTIAIGDTAISYVEEFSKDEKPFFLYIAHCAPHWPLHALPQDIAKYENMYKAGWDAIRKNRYQKMLSLGLLNPESASLSPGMFPKKKWSANPDTAFDARAMAVHAAMVDRLDQTIGKLVEKLKETGEWDNTIIMFLSDNGASSERPSKYGPGFDRAGSLRTGEEVAFPVEKNAMPGPQTVHAGIGPEWANVSNAPFRYWKAKVYEGGITTPFIVHWPNGITKRGTITDQPGHIVDIMATCLDMAGATYPKTFEDRDIVPMAGKSLGPVFQGKQREAHSVIFWEHLGASALRSGDWKIVRLNKNSKWELYDLSTDRTEVNNLADQFPEKVKNMDALYEKMALNLDVYPAPN